jgi:hypothetical protein
MKGAINQPEKSFCGFEESQQMSLSNKQQAYPAKYPICRFFTQLHIQDHSDGLGAHY